MAIMEEAYKPYNEPLNNKRHNDWGWQKEKNDFQRFHFREEDDKEELSKKVKTLEKKLEECDDAIAKLGKRLEALEIEASSLPA
jgi:chromosome segregation ATPase